METENDTAVNGLAGIGARRENALGKISQLNGEMGIHPAGPTETMAGNVSPRGGAVWWPGCGREDIVVWEAGGRWGSGWKVSVNSWSSRACSGRGKWAWS